MKFLRYLNPFYTARTIAGLKFDLELAEVANASLRDSRTLWIDLYRNMQRDFVTHEQAIDAFMDEREDLKAQIDTLEDAGLAVTEMFVRAASEAASYSQSLRDGGEQLRAIAEHLKVAEDRLAAAGIKLTTGENGPIVVVNQETFLAAVRAADHANGPDITLSA